MPLGFASVILEIVVLRSDHERGVDLQQCLPNRIGFLNYSDIHFGDPFSGSVECRRESRIVLEKVSAGARCLIGGGPFAGLVPPVYIVRYN